jgi:hypothetical protein
MAPSALAALIPRYTDHTIHMQLLRRIPRRLSAPSNEEEHTPALATTSRSPSQQPHNVPRTYSEETLVTGRSDEQQPAQAVLAPRRATVPMLLRSHSVLSTTSDSTAVDLVMGHSFNEFTNIRSLPVLSMLFQKGTYVFPSQNSLDLFKSTHRSKQNLAEQLSARQKGYALPLLQCTTPILSVFKRNYPILIIYKFKTPELPTGDELGNNTVDPMNFNSQKIEYCRVYLKFFRNGTVRYTLKFTPNGKPSNSDYNTEATTSSTSSDPEDFEVTLIMNTKTAFVDTIYKGTRMRWVGTTSPSSFQGSGFFRLLVMNDESPGMLDHESRMHRSLLEGTDTDDDRHLPSALTMHMISTDLLASLSSFPPIARFSDTCNRNNKNDIPMKQKIPQKLMFRSNGTIKVMEARHTANHHDTINGDDGISEAGTNNDGEQYDAGHMGVTGPVENRSTALSEEADSILNVSEETLVLSCMALVLRDHENKKNSGNSRGFDDHTLNTGAFY